MEESLSKCPIDFILNLWIVSVNGDLLVPPQICCMCHEVSEVTQSLPAASLLFDLGRGRDTPCMSAPSMHIGKKERKKQLISKIPYKINGAFSNTILHFEFLFDLPMGKKTCSEKARSFDKMWLWKKTQQHSINSKLWLLAEFSNWVVDQKCGWGEIAAVDY